MDEVSLLLAHLAVGIVWIGVAVVLLATALRVGGILRENRIESVVFKPVLIAGYAFIVTGLLHFVEELLELAELDMHAISVGLVNHVVIVALFASILYSLRRYRGMLETLTKQPAKAQAETCAFGTFPGSETPERLSLARKHAPDVLTDPTCRLCLYPPPSTQSVDRGEPSAVIGKHEEGASMLEAFRYRPHSVVLGQPSYVNRQMSSQDLRCQG